MAGLGFIALLDDIGSMMDKVAAIAKANMGAASSVADKTGQALGKTAGVVGDDVALGADALRVDQLEERIGLMAHRELKIVWAVAKGSAVNKVWISALAWALMASTPWALHALLALGGAYLCMEGAQKAMSAAGWGHSEETSIEVTDSVSTGLNGPVMGAVLGKEDLAQFERAKIKGAVRTDMVLSGEIILITLGSLSGLSLAGQALGLFAVGMAMTVGVYGSVAVLVKLDDAGLWLHRQGQVRKSAWMEWTGMRLMVCMPTVMRALTVLGVVAMLGVGGGILVHLLPAGSKLLAAAGSLPWVGWAAESALAAMAGLMVGVALELCIASRAGQVAVESAAQGAKLTKACWMAVLRRF